MKPRFDYESRYNALREQAVSVGLTPTIERLGEMGCRHERLFHVGWLILNRIPLSTPRERCWTWGGSFEPRGYPLFHGNFYGVTERAGRVVYGLLVSLPGTLEVCHSCDNPACVNPSHLWLGTQVDNMKDMDAKGRRHNSRGEAHCQSILTDAIVRQSRAMRADGMMFKDIASQFGVNQETIRAAVHGKTRWVHVL